MCSSWFIVMNFSCTFDELWNSKKDHLENGSKRRLSQKPKKYSKWWFEVLQGVWPRVTSVHEFVVWWSGFDFFVISLPGVWLDSTFENSTNQITWFQSSINVKFLKRETKSSSADCHDDDLFYIPMFYLPFFLIFRIMHPRWYTETIKYFSNLFRDGFSYWER